MRIGLVAVWLVLLAQCVGAFTRPVLTVVRLPEGAGKAGVWSVAPQVLQLPKFRVGALPLQGAQVRLAYDDNNLYVAFRCMEEQMDKLALSCKDRDGAVWNDDSIEVFLCPGEDSKRFYHVIANAVGVVYDEKDALSQPKSWDGNWSVETGREQGAWTAVFTIPFEQMGLDAPAAGSRWLVNLCRTETRLQERTCWSPVASGFCDPERFGSMVFGGQESVSAALEPFTIVSPGKHSAKIVVNNTSEAVVPLRVVVSISESPVKEMVVEAEPGVSEKDVEFGVNCEGNRTLHVAVYRKLDDGVVAVSPGCPVRIPEYGAQLAKLRGRFNGIEGAPGSERNRVAGVLGEAESFAKAADGDAAWGQLGEKLPGVESAVERLRFLAADVKKVGYVLGCQSSMVKVRRDAAYWESLGGCLKIDMPRNDYEAAQLVIVAYEKALSDVAVSVGRLVGPNGAVIPADGVVLNYVDYVKTRKPNYDVSYVGWYPDPLMPMRQFDVAQGSVQPVWITVRAPEGTPAGVYKGTIEVRPANATVQSLPVEVRVRDFSLPKETHMKTAFAFFETEVEAWYGKYTVQMHRDYYDFLLQHRINPTNIYSPGPVPSKYYISHCMSEGMNSFTLASIGNPDEKCLEMIGDYESFLKKYGWWGKAYVYGWDEVQPANYPAAHDAFKKIKDNFPDLTTMCTVVPNKELDDVIDIWVPLTPNFDRKVADEYEARGDEVWWYVCCQPLHPYANWFVDYSAVEPRLLFWMNWKYKVPGFLYYAINMWESNRRVEGLPANLQAHDDPAAVEAIKAGKRWPEVAWNTFTFDRFNGDGHLIYPGADGKPISSIRLECIRDGIEDYECFYLLRERLKSAEAKGGVSDAVAARARKALEVGDDVVKSTREFTYDPALVLKARGEVLDLIEELSCRSA